MNAETTRLTDPVCGMSVRLDAATQDGLALEHHGTLYAFCRSACLDAFRGDPHTYAESHKLASPPAGKTLTVIDEGMRRSYDSCSCCLGDAYPEVKAALDEERQLNSQRPAADGICEVAEAGQPS